MYVYGTLCVQVERCSCCFKFDSQLAQDDLKVSCRSLKRAGLYSDVNVVYVCYIAATGRYIQRRLKFTCTTYSQRGNPHIAGNCNCSAATSCHTLKYTIVVRVSTTCVLQQRDSGPTAAGQSRCAAAICRKMHTQVRQLASSGRRMPVRRRLLHTNVARTPPVTDTRDRQQPQRPSRRHRTHTAGHRDAYRIPQAAHAANTQARAGTFLHPHGAQRALRDTGTTAIVVGEKRLPRPQADTTQGERAHSDIRRVKGPKRSLQIALRRHASGKRFRNGAPADAEV
jgi:hypothetical protein